MISVTATQHFIAVVIFLVISLCSAEECTQVDMCSCKFANGSVIDISPLGKTDGYPRFNYEPPLAGQTKNQMYGWQYAFNPCYGFNDTYRCSDVVACQRGNGTEPGYISYFPLGDTKSAKFTDGGATITYTSHTDNTRTVILSLVCDPSVKKAHPKFYRIGEFTGSDGPEYNFVLASVCACADGCTT